MIKLFQTDSVNKQNFCYILLLFSHEVVSDSLGPMDCSTPGFPLLHHLLKFARTNVHWVGEAIQPSHPLSSASPPAFSLSQHQALFQGDGSLHQVSKGSELELQHPSFQWIFRVDFLWDWLVWSPCCPRDSREPSPAPQFKSFIYLLPITFTHQSIRVSVAEDMLGAYT